MSHRIVVSDTKETDLEPIAAELGDAIVETSGAQTPEAVIKAARGADGLIVDSNTSVTARVIDELDSLSVVGRGGIGVDNVDVRAASDHDVTVVNVPDYCLDEVSTHALSLILACLRRLVQYNRSVAEGTWDWRVGAPIDRLAGKAVGLVAFGKIARRLAAKLEGFDVTVLAFDPYVPDAEIADFGVEPVDFERLLEQSSIVSIHAPLTDETRGLFDADAFDRMRGGSILINTARGPIVEKDALLAALENGSVDSAGLDVRETEPPMDDVLAGREDVVCTPHVAWYSEESRIQLSRTVAEDVARVLRGEEPANPVDPESGWF